ncbi:hypothetical protein Ait01nite_029900 [Actinoplanes italicus]|uniref:Uncharacterized protein n=1 Tax=Actinoplanes italicus TaxID=113567 RepID=A0A2T0KJE7_9ACTN|nr:hypothetical protein [Actinoplanes italicus]PRX23446.1 hypothetical protein CLV67_103194 [Actinoplanes italicus]GIE29945.1 hypothetical protein Ait01nite_029900 [Actinoplanes italicus]
MRDLRPGDMVRLGKAASVQFATPILFRIIRVLPRQTYVGWVWLDGYEMSGGIAVERREVFVQWLGIEAIGYGPSRRTRNDGPAQRRPLAAQRSKSDRV